MGPVKPDHIFDAAVHIQNALTTVESLADALGFRVTTHLVMHLTFALQALEGAYAEVRESEPCDRGTPGCSVGRHEGSEPCQTW